MNVTQYKLPIYITSTISNSTHNSKYNIVIIPDTIIYNLICTYIHL